MISLTGLFLGLTTVIPLYLAERLMLGNSAWILLLLLVPTMCSIPFFYWGQAWIIKSVRATTPQACWPELLDQTEQDELGAA